jgi:hypothetical protein
MILWLPCCRTSTNPFSSRIRQTSKPEMTRSLPNRHLNLRDKNLAVEAPGNFGCVRSLEEQSKRPDQVRLGLFNRRTWLAISSSGQSETKPSSSRSMIAVKRICRAMIRVYNSRPVVCEALFAPSKNPVGPRREIDKRRAVACEAFNNQQPFFQLGPLEFHKGRPADGGEEVWVGQRALSGNRKVVLARSDESVSPR